MLYLLIKDHFIFSQDLDYFALFWHFIENFFVQLMPHLMLVDHGWWSAVPDDIQQCAVVHSGACGGTISAKEL